MKYRRASMLVVAALATSVLTAQAAHATGSSAQSAKDKAPCTAKLISAHEGIQTHADADTIASQKAAFRQGANLADSDVWVTKDGYIVEMHANDVSITTNGTGLVTQMTLNQILALHTKRFHDPIPTFDDSLAIPTAHKPGRYLMFETKYSFSLSHPQYLQQLAAEITAAGMTDHVVIYSAYPDQLTYLKQIDPGLTVWFKAGSVPPLQQVEGYDGVMLDAGQMNAHNVAMFHAAGLSVIRQRSGESPQKWQAFLASGADGLMSEHAKQMVHLCRKLG